MSECWLRLPQTTVGVSDVVVKVGVARIAQRGELQGRNGAVPISGPERAFADRKIRVELGGINPIYNRAHGRADRPRFRLCRAVRHSEPGS